MLKTNAHYDEGTAELKKRGYHITPQCYGRALFIGKPINSTDPTKLDSQKKSQPASTSQTPIHIASILYNRTNLDWKYIVDRCGLLRYQTCNPASNLIGTHYISMNAGNNPKILWGRELDLSSGYQTIPTRLLFREMSPNYRVKEVQQ